MLMATDPKTLADLASEPDDLEINCFDPWLIAYARPRQHDVAKHSLEREGYECWYPVRKVISFKPARNLPSKTRHRRRFEVVEKIEPVLGSYLFIRQIRPVAVGCPLYELNGVGGLCQFGGITALMRDYDIELIRLAEANGKFNVFHENVPTVRRLAVTPDPRAYTGETRLIGRLDHVGESVQFIASLDRVLRKVRAAHSFASCGPIGYHAKFGACLILAEVSPRPLAAALIDILNAGRLTDRDLDILEP
jgi:hypothetical protein